MQRLTPPAELLDDLCVRFILTLPATELESFERLLFSVEQAWWHYEDHIRHKEEYQVVDTATGYLNSSLKSLNLKEFTGLIFKSCPGLEPFHKYLDKIYDEFNAYKSTVPVRGAILLDPTMSKCLLVRGFKESSSWGFPRGKLSLNESDAECAAREVMEETGFDIADKLDKKEYIEMQIGNQETKLFIIRDVDDSTAFAPHVRGEIGGFGWHMIDDLPATKDESKQLFVNLEGSRHRFFNVWPYVKKLRYWISKQKKEKNVLKAFRFDKEAIIKAMNAKLMSKSGLDDYAIDAEA